MRIDWDEKLSQNSQTHKIERNLFWINEYFYFFQKNERKKSLAKPAARHSVSHSQRVCDIFNQRVRKVTKGYQRLLTTKDHQRLKQTISSHLEDCYLVIGQWAEGKSFLLETAILMVTPLLYRKVLLRSIKLKRDERY